MAKDILSNLTPAKDSRKSRKRIGRGQGSGHGGTATRGHKGAGSRSGTVYYPWFEGGQMPLVRRVPKRGFTNPFRVEYQVVNVGTLGKLAADGKIPNGVISPEALSKLGVVRKSGAPIKVLGNGDLKTGLSISANAFSRTAIEKIEKAGGKAEMISKTKKE